MSPRAPRPARTTLVIPLPVQRSLEERGARRHLGPGPRTYRRQLTQSLETFDNLLRHSDPRRTKQMPQDLYDQVLDLLTNPLSLESSVSRCGGPRHALRSGTCQPLQASLVLRARASGAAGRPAWPGLASACPPNPLRSLCLARTTAPVRFALRPVAPHPFAAPTTSQYLHLQ